MSSLFFRRCSGTDAAFLENCLQLDRELERRMGAEVQKDYVQYNHVYDQIPYAVTVYCNNELAGSGAMKEYEEHVLEMKRVFVRPDLQGQGIGTALTQYLLDWAKELGCRKMILESGAPLCEAHHIYEKLGFHRIPNFGPFAGMETSYCYEKTLED